MTPVVERLVVLAYRLGLGWLAGRRYAVLTTTGPDKHVTHSVTPLRWRAGEIIVPIEHESERWVRHLTERPVAMVQAAPGPLSAVAERRGDAFVFRPTGQPAPYPVDSDLIWVIPAVIAVLIALRLFR